MASAADMELAEPLMPVDATEEDDQTLRYYNIHHKRLHICSGKIPGLLPQPPVPSRRLRLHRRCP